VPSDIVYDCAPHPSLGCQGLRRRLRAAARTSARRHPVSIGSHVGISRRWLEGELAHRSSPLSSAERARFFAPGVAATRRSCASSRSPGAVILTCIRAGTHRPTRMWAGHRPICVSSIGSRPARPRTPPTALDGQGTLLSENPQPRRHRSRARQAHICAAAVAGYIRPRARLLEPVVRPQQLRAQIKPADVDFFVDSRRRISSKPNVGEASVRIFRPSTSRRQRRTAAPRRSPERSAPPPGNPVAPIQDGTLAGPERGPAARCRCPSKKDRRGQREQTTTTKSTRHSDPSAGRWARSKRTSVRWWSNQTGSSMPITM